MTEIVKKLKTALKSDCRVTTTIKSKIGQRDLSIQRFALVDSEWHIDCWCHTEGRFERFPVSEIEDIEERSKEALLRPPAEMLKNAFSNDAPETSYQDREKLDLLEKWLDQTISANTVGRDAGAPDLLLASVRDSNQDESTETEGVYKKDQEALQKTVVRHVGKAPNAPAPKRAFGPANVSNLEVDEEASFSKRMVSALEAHISEIKKYGKASRSLYLTDGISVFIQGHGNCYRFEVETGEYLQEGFKVFATVNRRRISGKVISVGPDHLFVVFDVASDTEIRDCVVQVDNTQLLSQLKDRMNTVRKNKDRFNTKLASNVIRGKQEEKISRPRPAVFNESLNASQKKAISSALESDVSYIWGPPGTGKTLVLSELVRILYQQGEKVLVCSHTNQAVDQLLLKLCEGLKKNNRGLNDGEVVRIGEIEHQELSGSWGDFVDFELIAVRKTKKLQEEKNQIEQKIKPLRTSLVELQVVKEQFALQDQIIERLSKANAELARTRKKKKHYEDKYALRIEQTRTEAQKIREQIRERRKDKRRLSQERVNKEKAVLQFRHRSHTTINRDLKAANDEIERLEVEILPSVSDKENGLDLKFTQAMTKLEENNAKDLARKTRVRKELKHLNEKLAKHNRGTVTKKISDLETKINPLQEKINELSGKILEIRKAIATNAKVLGASITKTYLDPDIFQAIDVVIIDEASMALLPSVAIVSAIAKKSVVVSGDFQQLQPIVNTRDVNIREEIGTSVFEYSGIQEICKNGSDTAVVTMLDTQYRMPKGIADLVSKPFYGGRLKTGYTNDNQSGRETKEGEQSIFLVDTGSLNSLDQVAQDGSRYNLSHAAVVRNIVLRLRDQGEVTGAKSLGICSPFKAQARLLNAIVQDEGLQGYTRAATVHRWQGDEADSMILDLTIGESRRKVGHFFDSEQVSEDNAKVLNVALTRAKKRLIIVAHLEVLDNKLPNYAVARDILARAEESGQVIPAEKFLPTQKLEVRKNRLRQSLGTGSSQSPPFGRVVEKPKTSDILRTPETPVSTGNLIPKIKRSVPAGKQQEDTHRVRMFDEKTFSTNVQKDIKSAKKSVAIYSGFVTENRVRTYLSSFNERIQRGVAIRCITRPPVSNGKDFMRQTARNALGLLKKSQCRIDLRAQIHQKIVIIDEEIVWFGSLNPLSHTTRTDETMQRTTGKHYARELAGFVALDFVREPDKASGISVLKENPNCPECKTSWVTLVSRGEYGKPHTWRCEKEKCGHRWQGGSAIAKKKKTSGQRQAGV